MHSCGRKRGSKGITQDRWLHDAEIFEEGTILGFRPDLLDSSKPPLLDKFSSCRKIPLFQVKWVSPFKSYGFTQGSNRCRRLFKVYTGANGDFSDQSAWALALILLDESASRLVSVTMKVCLSESCFFPVIRWSFCRAFTAHTL